MEVIEECACWVYGDKWQVDIDEVRPIMSEAKSKPKNSLKPLDDINSINLTLFPSCQKVLELRIKRACYIASSYKTSVNAYPWYEQTPIDFRWWLFELPK